MEKARNSGILKIVCYIAIPILVAIVLLSIFHMAFLSEFGTSKEETTYVQTDNFADNYLYFFINKIYSCSTEEREKRFEELEDEQGNFYCYYEEPSRYYSDGTGLEKSIQYIIVEKETGKIFTNIKSNNYQEVMDNMKNQEIYWNLIDGKIETNLTYINQENIKYNYIFNHIRYNGKMDYNIYSSLDEDASNLGNGFGINKTIYDFMLQHRQLPIYSCMLGGLLLLAIAFYLFWAIGHKKGKKEIDLNTLDKMPYEMISAICFFVVVFILEMVIIESNTYFNYLSIMMWLLFYFVRIHYLCCVGDYHH